MKFYDYNKYGAKKETCSQGHLHDSRAEALRCAELHLLLRVGDIENLELQKDYLLIPARYITQELSEVYKVGEKKGQHKTKQVCDEQSVVYKADFVYYDKRLNKTVIEDCKGMRTKEYVIKRKLVKQLYCNNDTTIFIET